MWWYILLKISPYCSAKWLPRCPCGKRCPYIGSCVEFLKLSSDDRRKCALRLKLCVNCLSRTHFVDCCPSDKNCKYCKIRHHSSLHYDRPPVKPVRLEAAVQTEIDGPFEAIRTEATFARQCIMDLQRFPKDQYSLLCYAEHSLTQLIKCLPNVDPNV